MIKTQLIAVSVISKVLAGSSLTSVLYECWQQHATLSSQQKGAIQDFCYGVLRFYGQLTEILAILLSKTLQDKKIYYLLLISLYQLLYSKLPVYTVVNQTVSASRKLASNKKMQGLVNAVLRNFLRQKETLLIKAAKKEVGFYSHPQWWIDKLRTQYPQHFHAILNADNKRPPMALRVNQRKISVTAYQQLLSDNGMESQLVWPHALLLKNLWVLKNYRDFMKDWYPCRMPALSLQHHYLMCIMVCVYWMRAPHRAAKAPTYWNSQIYH